MTLTQDILDQLRKMQSDFLDHLAENKAAHKELSKELKRHGDEEQAMRKHIFGNGSVGLMEQVRTNTRFRQGWNKAFWIFLPIIAGAELWQAIFR